MPHQLVVAFFVHQGLFCSLAKPKMRLKKVIIFYFCLSICFLCAQAQIRVDAGAYQKICPGTQANIGGAPTAAGGSGSYQYTWHAGASLLDSTVANPIAQPNITTTYTVFVKDIGGTGDLVKDTVTVYVYPYAVNAGPDTTIKSGQTIGLHGQASGSTGTYWAPTTNIYNQNTLTPDVFPTSTTQYTLTAVFPNGCSLYDVVIVNVLPSNELFFFNSFSPNGDNVNDYFFIGNIGLYPNNTLEIYNRYGQKVFSKTAYNNDWNGSYLGTDLPCGTYFYILDTHDSPGKYKGEVNIIK
jgi:gliding motility-associated-like protein